MQTQTTTQARPVAPDVDVDERDTVIHVENLRKTYGSKVAVRDVSFTVRRGEIFGILGPNGAGKTTTVETLANLRDADGGTIEVLGVDPARDPARIRELVGVQLQESTLQAKITVREALRLYGSFYRRSEDPEHLIRLLGLQEKADTAFEDLSGGQKQRLSIALALVGKPEIAILDELTTGLDPQARRDTWDLIEQVRDQGVTIVLVTHFMDEAERLCDRLVVIDDGVVAAAGSPAELTGSDGRGRSFRLRLPDGVDVEALGLDRLPEVSAITLAKRGWTITGEGRVLAAVVTALDAQGVIPEEVSTSARSLEDVFVDLVRDGDHPSTDTPKETS